MVPARIGLLLLLALPAAGGAQPCAQPGPNGLAREVKAAQSQLLAYKLQDDLDEDVPAALYRTGHHGEALSAAAGASRVRDRFQPPTHQFTCLPAGIALYFLPS